MKLRRLIILASGGLMLLGAACGGDSDSTDAVKAADESSVTTAASDDRSDARGAGCDALSKTDVEAIFGGSFGEIQDSSQSGTTICTTQKDDPVTNVQFVIKPSSAGEFDATVDYSKKSGAKAESVSGIGSKAMRLTTSQMGITVIQVMAVKGSALFYVTTSADGSSAPDKAEQLTKLLADRL